MNVTSLADMFDKWLGDIQYDPNSDVGQLYPFFVRVGCIKMAAPRHERFDLIREMGTQHVEHIFTDEPFGTDELTLVFPERWMSVHEQQSVMHKLVRHPDVGSIKRVDILTSSALMISSFKREQIRILTFEDDERFNGGINRG